MDEWMNECKNEKSRFICCCFFYFPRLIFCDLFTIFVFFIFIF